MLASARNRYRAIDNVTSVSGRSPAELILLVYDRIGDKLGRAEAALAQQSYREFQATVREATDLITQGLIAALDFERGGEVAHNLSRLYDYAVRRLLQANLQGDITPVREVAELLRGLRTTWAGLLAPAGSLPH